MDDEVGWTDPATFDFPDESSCTPSTQLMSVPPPVVGQEVGQKTIEVKDAKTRWGQLMPRPIRRRRALNAGSCGPKWIDLVPGTLDAAFDLCKGKLRVSGSGLIYNVIHVNGTLEVNWKALQNRVDVRGRIEASFGCSILSLLGLEDGGWPFRVCNSVVRDEQGRLVWAALTARVHVDNVLQSPLWVPGTGQALPLNWERTLEDTVVELEGEICTDLGVKVDIGIGKPKFGISGCMEVSLALVDGQWYYRVEGNAEIDVGPLSYKRTHRFAPSRNSEVVDRRTLWLRLPQFGNETQYADHLYIRLGGDSSQQHTPRLPPGAAEPFDVTSGESGRAEAGISFLRECTPHSYKFAPWLCSARYHT